jgi:HSP20 family molecular chaperone IbpA
MNDQVRAIYRALTGEDVYSREFKPPLDVIAGDEAVIVEIALPGVGRDAIEIERDAEVLRISGIRPVHHDVLGTVFHAEIRRGAFFRAIPLPFPLAGEPRIELADGILRLHLPVASTTTARRRDDSQQTSRTEQHSGNLDQNSGNRGEGHEQDGR